MAKKRKKTELGRTLAKIRIDFDETGADMAKKLGVSASQMFNIEVGLAQIGYDFVEKVKEVYEIDLSEIMERGGFLTKMTLDLDELSAADRKTVMEIWSRRGKDGEPPKEQPVAIAPVAAAKPAARVFVDDKDPAPVAAEPRIMGQTKSKLPTLSEEGCGFLDEDENFDALEPGDVE